MTKFLLLCCIGFFGLGYYFLPSLTGILHFHCYYFEFCSGEKVVEQNLTLNFQTDDVITISHTGSTRATAYPYLTKLIQLDKGFAISWLDVTKSDFRLKVRIFDENSISSVEYDLGSVVDNHGGGSLATTEGNILHVVYFPHSTTHALYRNALVKNPIEWSNPVRIGDHLTYPNIVSYKDKIVVIARRNRHRIGRDNNVELVAYYKHNSQYFGKAEIVLEAELPGYARFDAEILVDDVNDELYLVLKRHEGSIQDSYGWLQSVGLTNLAKLKIFNHFLLNGKRTHTKL